MGAERGRNRCCGTDMHAHSHFSVLTHSLNIRFVSAKLSMAQRHPNLKTQILHSLFLHLPSFQISNPQAHTAPPSPPSSLSRVSLPVRPSVATRSAWTISLPADLHGWADDWVPLTAPENPTRGHRSRTSQVRVSGKERGTVWHGEPSDLHSDVPSVVANSAYLPHLLRSLL